MITIPAGIKKGDNCTAAVRPRAVTVVRPLFRLYRVFMTDPRLINHRAVVEKIKHVSFFGDASGLFDA